MAESKKISSVLRTYMPVASKSEEMTREEGGAATPPPMMGDKLNGVIKIANRWKERQSRAQSRVRTLESKVFSAIGQVIGDAAALKNMSPIDLLGLSEYIAKALEKSEIRLEIRQRGIAIYEANYARAKTLCMLGAVGSKDVAEALRAAGFVRVGEHWAGPANIVQATAIAFEHGLTLLRHEEHDVIHYIRKGVRQPALDHLEAEHAAMLAQVTAVLAAPDGNLASKQDTVADGRDAEIPVADRPRARSSQKDDPADGNPQGEAKGIKSEAVASASQQRMGFGRAALARPASRQTSGDEDA
jgi:hypothetical protein